MRWTIVSSSNDGYFPLLQGLILSISDRTRAAGQAMPDIHILDIGLTDDQRHWLEPYVKGFVRPSWDVGPDDAAFLETHGGEAFKPMTARPNLPRHVPGYDSYLWIDADAWVQRWEGIDWYLEAARGGRMAVTPAIHRAFAGTFHTSPRQEALFEVHRWCVEESLAKALVYQLQQINSGVFALEAESPVWEIWADCNKQILTRLRVTEKFTSLFEQIALNVAIYTRRAPIHFLPVSCNWPIAEGDLMLDLERKLFVEPLVPHEPIGILHVIHTALGDAKAKMSPIEVLTRNGGPKLKMAVDYLSVRKNLLGLKTE